MGTPPPPRSRKLLTLVGVAGMVIFIGGFLLGGYGMYQARRGPLVADHATGQTVPVTWHSHPILMKGVDGVRYVDDAVVRRSEVAERLILAGIGVTAAAGVLYGLAFRRWPLR